MTGSILPITGWWPDINVDFNLSVPPSLHPSGFAPLGMDVNAPPSLTFAASGKSAAAFALAVQPSLTSAGVPVEPGAFGLSVAPSLAFTGAAQQPGAFTLAVPPSLAAAGVPVMSGAFGLSVPLSLSFTGAPFPSYDNSAKSARQISLASGSPFTWSSGTSIAGAYGLVFVACQSGVMDLVTTTAAVTWGGVTMTSLGNKYNNNNSTLGWGWLFGLNGIPGGAQTISVTLTEAGKTFSGYGSSYSYANVSSVGTLQTASGVTVNPSLAVTAANSTDIVWGAINTNNAALSAFSLTTRQDNNITTSAPVFWAGDTTGSTSVTVGGTATAQWSAFGIDLK